MADVAFAFILFVGLISGLRRGFVKPAIGIVALVVATMFSVHLYAFAGPFAAQRLGVPAPVGFLVGGLGAFTLAYFVTALVGRLVWKGARGQTAMQRIDDAAGGAADAMVGKTAPGPVTLMLKPVPTAGGVLYWLDKIAGAILGVAQAALVILVVLFAAATLPMGKVGHRVRDSSAYKEYQAQVEPMLEDVDAARFVRSIGDVSSISDDIEEQPALYDALAMSKELEPLRSYTPIHALAEDPALKAALASKRYGDALKNEKVVALLSDPEVLRRILAVDWKAVRRQVDAERAAAAAGKAGQKPPGADAKTPAAPAGGGK